MNSKPYQEEACQSARLPSPIECELDNLSIQLDYLEKAVASAMNKTEMIRNPMPSILVDAPKGNPSGSTVTMRIANSANRLRKLREDLEQCVSEIEL